MIKNVPEICPAEVNGVSGYNIPAFPPQEAVLCQGEVVGVEPAALDIAVPVTGMAGSVSCFQLGLATQRSILLMM